MDKHAAVVQKGSELKKLLLKVATENGHNMAVARYNALAKMAGESVRSYKNDAFLDLIREIDSLVGLALGHE